MAVPALPSSMVQAVDGGWRTAWIVNGDFEDWLCPHVHDSPEAAHFLPLAGHMASWARGRAAERSGQRIQCDASGAVPVDGSTRDPPPGPRAGV